MNSILNISAYKFVPLPDAADVQALLHTRAQALGLKGTILLADGLTGTEFAPFGFAVVSEGTQKMNK